MSSTEVPVLIVGGGPVGLTLGTELARLGRRCLLVERRTEPTKHPKATLLGARSMEFYRRWGLTDAIYAKAINQDLPYYIVFTTRLAGQELSRFRSPSIAETRGRSRETLARFRELNWSPYGKTQIGQQALEPVLLDHAREQPQLEMRHGWVLRAFEQDDRGVVAQLQQVSTGRIEVVRAQYLVGCDGGTSGVRRQLGVRYNGRGKMRANVSFFFRSAEFLEAHGRGVANLYFVFAPDSFGVFTAIDGAELWNYQYYFLDPDKATEALDPEAILHRAMGKPFAFELLATQHWHHHQSVAERWRDRRVFLAGDAAHLFVPTGGVGMNTGIGDAFDLAWKLDASLAGWGGPGLLDTYEIERKPIAIRNSILSASNSDRIDMVMSETPADIDNANEQVRAELSRKIRYLSRQFNSAGVHLGYRYVDSPIIVGDGMPEPPDDPAQVSQSSWPGCRAPHAWLPDGRSTLALVGGAFVLLRFASETPGDVRLVGAARGCAAAG
ncbi:MAG: FAD-dependent monooxygenase [Hyphomonadaceae bacterium]